MKYCPMCGAKFVPRAKFCWECGLSVAEYEKKLERIKKPPQKPVPSPRLNTKAMMRLAYMLMEGRGVPKDTTRAVELLKKAAKLKDVDAMFALGRIYFDGDKVPKNSQRAREWWSKAAAAGSADALIALWKIQIGKANVIELPATLPPITPEQKLENERLLELGLKYYSKQDYGIAIEHLKPAAALGNTEAMEVLGEIYSKEGTKYFNCEQAMFYYAGAARADKVFSMLRIGWIYENTTGFSQNHEAAIAWYKKAFDILNERAANDDPEAILQLAYMCKAGQYMKRSEEKYNELVLKAINLGNAAAMGVLGNDYYNEGDYIKGREWCFKAAKSGDVQSMIHMAQSYEFGLHNFPRDFKEAIKWYQKIIDVSPGERNDELRKSQRNHINDCREKIWERARRNTKEKSPLKALIDDFAVKFPVKYVYYFSQTEEGDRKLGAAVRAYGALINGNEDVLGCYDAKRFGGANEGCIFTLRGLYILTTGVDNEVRFVDYEDIINISVRGAFMKNVYVNDLKVDTSGIDEEETLKLCEMLKNLRDAILNLKQAAR